MSLYSDPIVRAMREQTRDGLRMIAEARKHDLARWPEPTSNPTALRRADNMTIRELQLAQATARDKLQSAACGDNEREISNARNAFDTACAALRNAEFGSAGNADRFIPHGVADDPKLAGLRSRTALGRYLEASISGKRVTGAEEEFRAEVGGQEGHIPYDLFGPDRQFVNVDSATEAPGTTGINMGALVHRCFRSICRCARGRGNAASAGRSIQCSACGRIRNGRRQAEGKRAR